MKYISPKRKPFISRRTRVHDAVEFGGLGGRARHRSFPCSSRIAGFVRGVVATCASSACDSDAVAPRVLGRVLLIVLRRRLVAADIVVPTIVAVLPNWVVRHELSLAAGPSPAAPDQAPAAACDAAAS